MRTSLRKITISKSVALRKEYPLPQFKVASYKRPGIRFSFEDTTTLLPGGGGGTNRYGYAVSKNALQVCNFIWSFVQNCSKPVSPVSPLLLTGLESTKYT